MHLRNFILLLMIVIITSCGYHLRRPIDLPEQYKNLYVQGASYALKTEIKKVVKTSSAKMVSTPEEAGLVLNIIEDDLTQNVLSLGSTGKATEYELYYLLTFELIDAEGKIVMSRETLELNRDYFDDQSGDTVLGKAAEANTIRQEMYKQAVRNIFDRARVSFRKLGK
jgi:LPS-assembly lipoprotein